MNSYSIPIDLILEILSRLPAKSVARFRCVSKLWASIICTPYFTDQLFLTISSAKPRLLFAIEEEEDGVWSFFSLPQLQNPYEKSSSTLVVAAEFHVKFPPGDLRIHPSNDLQHFHCAYASGLIYFNGCHKDDKPLVCNPITGRYAILPYLHRYIQSYSFLGFEPIDKQYKVLLMAYPSSFKHHKILTLGINMRWRKIKCSLRHEIRSEGVCINGVLYYLGRMSEYVIVCFDLWSEKFTFIYVEGFCRLINYKGKLAMIFWDDDIFWEDSEDDDEMFLEGWDVDDDISLEDSEDDVDIYSENDLPVYSEDGRIIKLHVWVLEDDKKQEWSKYAYSLNEDEFIGLRHDLFVAGVTSCGEIVFAMSNCTSKQPFYVFYFNSDKNTLQRVEIQGFGETSKKLRGVWRFVNHVEDLNVDNLKLLKSVHAPKRKRRR